MTGTPPAPPARYHDYDALRAFAMLIGLALHACLSFSDVPWVVMDRSRSGVFSLFFFAVHGFRMPVFFLMSGFFTAMLWRRRGVGGLLKQRALRIGLPLAIGMVTIVPLTWVAVLGAGRIGTERGPESAERDIWSAAAWGNLDALERHLASGADPDLAEPLHGQSPLAWATIGDQPGAVALLLDFGADPNARYGERNTALHTAAFFGRADCAAALLEAGADPHARNVHGETPLDTMRHGRKTTEFIAGLLRIPIDFEKVVSGRGRVKAMLSAPESPVGERGSREDGENSVAGLIEVLQILPIFHHLWFLWFLCWLVAGFILVVLLPLPALPRRLVISTARWLWIVPVTMLPQAAMYGGGAQPGFGPDTSIGLLPIPHVLLYYAVFFAFGALYFEARDEAGRVGLLWWIQLPLALVVLFPLSLAFSLRSEWSLEAAGEAHHLIAVLLETLFTWLMVFGLMGLFRRFLSRERPWVRYLSDSAYWLYLAHLPLIILAQAVVRTWPLPGAVKFVLVLGTVTAILLIVYRYAIRYTIAGTLLNGRRARPGTPTDRAGA